MKMPNSDDATARSVHVTSSSPNCPEWIHWMKKETLSRTEIFFFAMSIIVGKQFNAPFEGGLWVMITTMVLSGIGYVLLAFCLAEMTSTLPFSGGIYGFVRAFTIPVYGFYISWFELLINLFYHTTQVYLFAQIPYAAGMVSREMTLFYCGMTQVFLVIIGLLGGKMFWYSNTLLGMVSLVLILIYIFGSFPEADLNRWGAGEEFDFHNVLEGLPRASLSYLGIQVLSLTSKWAKDAKTDIPTVTPIAMIVMFFTAIGVTILGAANAPGIEGLAGESYPLTFGFSRIFKLSENQALWLSFPACLANIVGLTFAASRQAINLAKSGLSPPIFKITTPYLDTPYVAILTGCIVSFSLNVVIYYNDRAMREMVELAALISYMVFFSAFVAYIQFHRNFSTLTRSFVSPLGDKGAYVGMIIFGFSFIGSLIGQNGRFASIVTIIGMSIMNLLYFVLIGANHTFSEEERDKFFKAYVVRGNPTFFASPFLISSLSLIANATTKNKLRKAKHSRVAPSVSSTSAKKNQNSRKSADAAATSSIVDIESLAGKKDD